MLDRSHLQIIREVDRQGSLTAASRVLFLTQPALSHAIKKIEQQLGTRLWSKEGRNLRLTQAGQYLLGLANRLLPQLEHAEVRMRQFAEGQRGTLRIGMECHPCYQWLIKIVAPYLSAWPDVDVDVRQKFQFGGVGALFGYEIDVLVTPDPLYKAGLRYEAVFDYEQVLVVSRQHRFVGKAFVTPKQMSNETLITYPVEIETTDIMLQMVAAGRGVAALPRWLVEEYAGQADICAVRLGRNGIAKKIYLGVREADVEIDYLKSFVEMAREPGSS